MGTFGRIAIGARGQLSYGEETNWGDAVPPTQRIEFKTESFNNEIGALLSEALDPSRGISKQIQGVSNISGDVAIEQNTEGYETLYKHALGDSVTINKCDGGIRARVTSPYTSGGSTVTTDATDADWLTPAVDTAIVAVYKDSTTGLLTVESSEVYTNISSGVFTLSASFSVNLPVGAWIFQANDHATEWQNVYTHYIEAARDLPAGITWEVGRDVAFFVYSGAKVNTVENTFTAQEILQGTFSFLGKAEYAGADLLNSEAIGSTTLELTNYTAQYSDIGYAFQDDGGSFTDFTTEANDDTTNDVDIWPAAPAQDDAFYFGSTSQFDSVGIDLTTQGVGTTTTTVWEYWNGSAWTTLTFLSQGVDDFTEAVGYYINAFTPPSNWATTAVDSVTAYWIRARQSAATPAWTVIPLCRRLYLDMRLIGFAPAGTVQVGAENDITYTSITIDPVSETAQLNGVPATGAASLSVAHSAGEPVVPQVSWDTPADPPTTDPLSSFQAAVYIDGVAQEVLSATFTLNNNLYADKFQLGDRYRAGLPEQQRTVEGSINVEFDDMILYHKYINGTEAFFEIRCVDDSERIDTSAAAGREVYRQKHCIFPVIKYTGTTPQIGGPDQITHDMPFTGLRDIANDMNELGIIFVNTDSSI